MSSMFEKVKRYYNNGNGIWSKSWVKDAVAKGRITEEEYKEITGEEYAAD